MYNYSDLPKMVQQICLKWATGVNYILYHINSANFSSKREVVLIYLNHCFFQVLYMNNKDQTEITLLISYGKMLNENTQSREDLLLKIQILN